MSADPHCGYTPANCPYGDACADCGLEGRRGPRWTIYICADCGEHQHDHNRDECWKCGSGREWEEVRVMPAVEAA